MASTDAVASTDVLARAAALLAREAGMAPRERELAQALRDCCCDNGVEDADTYLARLEECPSLIDDLVGALAIGETYFFRDAGQFDLVRREIVPSLIREHGPALRVWSAGCASGEEAYSLAVALAETGVEPTPPVLGSDISRAALRKAEEGTYGEWSFRGVPDAVRERYFEREGARSRIRGGIRARVRFGWLNLSSESYPSLQSGIWGMHLIFCRNVLIYLTPEAIAHVARRLHDSLAPGGWLVTGASDPPLADLAPFHTVVTTAGTVYRRAAGEPAPVFAADLASWVAPSEVVEPAEERRTRVAHRSGSEPSLRCTERAAPPTAALEELRGRLHALADRGEHDEVARVLALTLKAYPLEPELHYLSALVCLEQGRDDAAAEAARRSLYLEPGLTVAAIALGAALRRLGDLRGARRAYRSAAAVLRGRSPDELVQLADGERAGGLLRSVDSLLALTEAAS